MKLKLILSLAVITILINSCQHEPMPVAKNIVNDITQLNPIRACKIIAPKSSDEIAALVKLHKGPISIGGGRYSQGGQTATENTLQIDMRSFNRVLSFSRKDKEITVQAGISWRDLIQYIDRYNLSVRIMQSYANFTVGGSLSVNVHGRYVGQGPIISWVKAFKIILADGNILTASPSNNIDIFYAAIGGYGGIGVISEVTLALTDNIKIERTDTLLKIGDYKNFFFSKIRNHPNLIFHNADIYPTGYDRVRAVTYAKTQKAFTVSDRLKPNNKSYGLERFAMKIVSGSDFGKWLRRSIFDPIHYSKDLVEWRNHEATYDVQELEPRSRVKDTYVLQEYFVPVDRFGQFYPKMVKILKDNKVNVINISIRHANKDAGSYLAWARKEVFAFVIYYKQHISDEDKRKVTKWTRDLINAAISEEGAYYLPYQIQATPGQFAKAYPNAKKFFSVKKKYDPEYKFRNKLFDAYYPVAKK